MLSVVHSASWRYTNISSIGLIEKGKELGELIRSDSNSQTVSLQVILRPITVSKKPRRLKRLGT